LFFTLMKNWAVAELGSAVRAMASVPSSFFSPFLDSIGIGARVFFCAMFGVIPPPWTMKPGITRWKIVPL
jgi:hypothetical protein